MHSSHNPMAYMLGATRPVVTINGRRPVEVEWGETPFDLPAGNHHVRVATHYHGEFGPVELSVTLRPGQVTTVYYRTPAGRWMKGAIGLAPQRTRGMVAVMAICVIVIVVAVLVVGLVS